MSRRVLDLPIDIPWKLIAVSPDMMDTTFGNKAFPFAFRSSLAISAFEPALDDLPSGIEDERVTYLKVSASITGYQPTKAEVDAGYAQFPAVPIEELNRVFTEYFACYGALLNVAVFPRRRTMVELTQQCETFAGLTPGKAQASPLVRAGVSYSASGQSQIQVLDSYPPGGDASAELNIANQLVVTFPPCASVSAVVSQRPPDRREEQERISFATLVPGTTAPNPFPTGSATILQREQRQINVVDLYPSPPDRQGELDLTDGLSVKFPACHRIDVQITQGKATPSDQIRVRALRAGQQVAAATATVDGYQTLTVAADDIDQLVFDVPRKSSSLVGLTRYTWTDVVPQPVTMDVYAGDTLVGSATAGDEVGRGDTLAVSGDDVDRVVLTAPSGNATLVKFCRSVPTERPVSIDDYPHIVEFEPKTRDLYQSASLQGEVLTASRGEIRTDKSMSHTESSQTGLSLSGKYTSPPSPYGQAEVTGSLSHTWGQTDNDSFSTQSDNARERRERTGTSTNLSQMYNLLTGYHVGTNRATFVMLPRPHMLQATDHRTFVKGLRMIEGVQEFFLVVRRPEGMDGLCVEVMLDTGHFPENVQVETPPPVYEYGSDDFKVSVHANSGTIGGGETKNVHDQPDSVYNLSTGWVVDRSKGDPGHPGVSEISVNDNQQSKTSLRAYDYRTISDNAVQVFGTINGAGWGGPGAIFERTYRVFRRSENPKPGGDPVVKSPFFITTRTLGGCMLSGDKSVTPVRPATQAPLTAGRAALVTPTAQATTESVVHERQIRMPSAAFEDNGPESGSLAVKELLRQIQFSLSTSWRGADRRAPGITSFLDTDYFQQKVADLLPEQRRRQRLTDVSGIPEPVVARLGEETTVAEAMRLPLAEFARRAGLDLAEAAEARSGLRNSGEQS
ncbi:hypothetical protein [Micromonospora chersina]|uniref:hypothetical protein n=1 Tax=Micromonospora chersina TaxID=47854 RepID=UPI003722A2DF